MGGVLRVFSASLLPLLLLTAAAEDTEYISGTSITGVTQQLDIVRTPALYTGDFGDCLGGQSLFEITKFDAAYYTDNSTVLFHLDGQSSITSESLLMRFSMDAYGKNRFQMTFDPCSVNIHSLCPLVATVPVEAWAVFPVGAQQVGNIPNLAFSIPDFEGIVKLQIFGNSTQSEIGCFQASLSNGNTVAYPQVVGPALAFLVFVATLASLVTAAHEGSVQIVRSRYAHSLPLMIIFETFQSIFFSGALQLNFPSVLSAWWSNFAWASGQLLSQSVVETANFVSGIHGSALQVGDAESSVIVITESEASLAQEIYGRSTFAMETTHQLSRRYNASDPPDYTWAGSPVNTGLVLPGTWTGFPGTLSAVKIAAADTFAVGLIWLLALLAVLITALTASKFSLEALAMSKLIEKDSLAYFRRHWIWCTLTTVLRTLFAAFTMIMTLAFYQMSFDGSAGTKALAAVFFLVFLLGLGTLVAYACYVRLKGGNYAVHSDRMLLIQRKQFEFVPWIASIRMSTLEKNEQLEEQKRPVISIPWFRIHYHDNDPDRVSVHQQDSYIQRFGWLSARYRRTRWWFFAVYFAYQLFRAAIVGGGSSTPALQVYLLLVYDIIAFFIFLAIDPFEGRRNAALAVWMLGISKILTTAFSITFLPYLNLNRITVTVFGMIIIVVQGLLTIGLMILIVLDVISSYLSRACDGDTSKPGNLDAVRKRCFSHLEKRAVDSRTTRVGESRLKTFERENDTNATPPKSSFIVNSVRRVSKIYDEDDETLESLDLHLVQRTGSRPTSIYSTHGSLPRGARMVRTSWSSLDVGDWDSSLSSTTMKRPESGIAKRLSSYSGVVFVNNTLGSLQEEKEDEAGENSAGPGDSLSSRAGVVSLKQSVEGSDVLLPEKVTVDGEGQGDDALRVGMEESGVR